MSIIVPNTQVGIAICIARDILCFKKLPPLGSICLISYKICSNKFLCWGWPRPESQKLAVEKDTHHLIVLYICNFFCSSASAAAVPGLRTDPALILLGAKESTTVTSHNRCLPTAQVTSVKPSGRF